MIINRKSLRLLRLLYDLILLNISFIIAAVYAQSFDILMSRSYMFVLQAGLNIIWYFSTALTNFYEEFYARFFAVHFVNLIKSIIAQAVTAVIFIFLLKEDLFTRNFILYYSVLLLLIISLRIILIKYSLMLSKEKGKNFKNLLIIGAGETGKNFYSLVKKNPDLGYNFSGFVSDEHPSDDNILGPIDCLEEVIKQKKIEEAVIAIPEYSYQKLEPIIRTCNIHAVKVHIIPDYFKFMSKKFSIEMIGSFPLITVRDEPLEQIQWRFIKRAFDIIFSILVLLLVCSWLFPILILLIKLDSKGPAFYVQDRIGVRNRKFRCYKFRTMIYQKEPIAFTPTIEGDPRITKLGKYLRGSNIDELPQFFNVLKGEMSIVGPRPHAIPYDQKYGKVVEEIRMRHNVRPGITGWAQIHGLRGDVIDESENIKRTIKRIEYDLWYIENWSFWLDLQIILLTIWEMIRGKSRGM